MPTFSRESLISLLGAPEKLNVTVNVCEREMGAIHNYTEIKLIWSLTYTVATLCDKNFDNETGEIDGIILKKSALKV